MINLNLTGEEVNIILFSLSKLPYENVIQLIPKIQQQSESQLQSPVVTES